MAKGYHHPVCGLNIWALTDCDDALTITTRMKQMEIISH